MTTRKPLSVKAEKALSRMLKHFQSHGEVYDGATDDAAKLLPFAGKQEPAEVEDEDEDDDEDADDDATGKGGTGGKDIGD